MRIVTWNVNSLPSRMPRMRVWLQVMKPDVLCLQETKIADEQFPYEDLRELGYEAVHRGDGRWNGVAILSRVGIDEVVTDLPDVCGFPNDDDPPEPRFLSAVCGGVQVVCVYVPNGRTLENPHYLYKLRWLSALHRFAAQPAAGPFKADWVIDPGVPVSFEPATVNRAGGQPCAHPLNSRIEFPCPQWRRAGLANATCCFSFNIYRIVN